MIDQAADLPPGFLCRFWSKLKFIHDRHKMADHPADMEIGQYREMLCPSKDFIEFLFDFLLTETFVRVIFFIEQEFYKEDILMTGWSFFFVLVGVSFLTTQVFRVVDAIERPAQRSRRRAVAR